MMRTDYIDSAKKKVGEGVTLAGWVHEIRDIGKLIFIQLRDKTGIMQVIAKKGVVPDEVLEKMKRNKEDVISVTGKIAENKVAPGGVEIVPSEVKVLSVVEKKLPIDPTGVVESDLDTRLNYRYLDLRKPEVAAIFRIKSAIIQEFRKKTMGMGFQEVHPTHIVAAATEGGTEVFPVEYFEQKAFLAQSPQLYKQLAVVGGIDKVMITSPVWRAEKHHTTTHLNEVIQMDVEMGFADDNDAMDVLSEVTLSVLGEAAKMKEELALLKTEINVPSEIKRYTYTEIVDRLNSEGENLEWGEDFSKEQEKKIYGILGEDLFIIHDWPTMSRAFYSMPREDKPEVCKAYDLLYKGLEISSGAQRIHIPEMLEEQLRKRGLDPANFQFYIDAFRVGAPPHSGWSIGLERITMKATGMQNIRECMMFPRDRTRVHP
ncbi:aspartate--tRNA(Asn) ligase [Candidatus Micrarchaeota archaeon]|nr:aspartate--tRNA(Asn) ligase [Candidatus Micrarchaeota archaeon]MBD3418403.1 aspartate--tRNA(Asn) ligase [Candidatus Micrarchaeota archaeon]